MKITKELRALGCVWMTMALAWGCSEPGPSAPHLADGPAFAHVTPNQGAAVAALPFHLSATGFFQGQDLAPGFGPPLFGTSTFDGRCSVPSDFVIRFGLSGDATHLGGFEGSVEHCTQLDFQTGALTVTDGVMTLTAADGDELHATYVGAPGPTGLEEQFTFDGGSGRFADATGRAVAHPRCDPSTGTCDFPMSGVISYDASGSSAQD